MGRKLRRKLQKEVKKKYSPEAVDKIMSEVDIQLIREMADEEVKFILRDFVSSLLVCGKANGISEVKLNTIIDDVKIDLDRKMKERRR